MDAADSFTAKIKAKAELVVAELRSRLWEASPRGMVARELSLTLESLNRLETSYQSTVSELQNEECQYDTEELAFDMPIDQSMPRPEVLALRAERRRLTAIYEQQRRELVFRLLTLLNKLSHLNFDDED